MKRQACAIQSAAKHNPNRDIFVLFPSPVTNEKSTSTSTILKILGKYKNIFFRDVDMTTITIGTPIEELEKRGDIYTSGYYIEHLSDLVRLVTLYKYGGLYMDTDFIILKSFDDIAKTFFITEIFGKMNNAAIGFSQKGFGHDLLNDILR